MKKVLLVATVQSHIGQFHKSLINMLHENGYQVDVAAKDNLSQKNGLTLTEPDNIYNICFSRSPFSLKNIKAYKELKKLIKENGYDIVHCNTPVGGVLSRMVCRKLRKKGKIKVLYEAHGFHFFKGGSKKNWLIWYPIEKWFARYTDVLVTINQMDYELASNKFKKTTVAKVPGVGVELEEFKKAEKNDILKEELGLGKDDFVLLSVGELNKNKNHETILKTLAKLNNQNIHYLICGNGPLKEYLENLINELNLNNQVHLLGYRRDIASICKISDVFMFPSKREGLGMASIEAMATGLPILTSNKHGINDYSVDGVTGYKYNPIDVDGFADGIIKLMNDPELRIKMGKENKKIAERYSVESAMVAIKEIYEKL